MKFICDCGTHVLVADYRKATKKSPENLWMGIYNTNYPSSKISKAKLVGDVWLFEGRQKSLSKFKGLFK